jgi:hypothetical protein
MKVIVTARQEKMDRSGEFWEKMDKSGEFWEKMDRSGEFWEKMDRAGEFCLTSTTHNKLY